MTQGSPAAGRDLGLEDAHALLTEGDPGPTPFVVDGVLTRAPMPTRAASPTSGEES